MDQPQKPTETQVSLRPTLGLLPILAITAAAVPAFAQETTTLDTIVVQADGKNAATSYTVEKGKSEKYTAPLLDTPKTVTVITEREIEERGATSLDDVLRTTPGITLQAGEGGIPAGTRPTVRGFDASNDMFIDGVRNGSRTTYEAFNLESVEISKGPGGTFSGAGSTGGSINMNTKVPQPGAFDNAALSFGTGAYVRGTLDSNREFGNLGVRLNVMAQHADDLGGRNGVSSERYGIAPTVSYKLTEKTKITAGLYHYTSNDTPDYGQVMSSSATAGSSVFAGLSHGTGSWSDPYMPVEVDTDVFYGVAKRDFRHITSDSGYARLDHEFDNGLKLTSTLRKNRDSNQYVVTAPGRSADGVTRSSPKSSARLTETVSFNTALSGQGDYFGAGHSYTLGLEISNTRTKSGNLTADAAATASNSALLATSPTDPALNAAWSGSYSFDGYTSQATTKARSLYAIDTITFSPQWMANVGLRYDFFDTATKPLGSGTSAALHARSEFVNGTIGVMYKPVENGTVYASYGTSANPSGLGTNLGGDDSLSSNNEDLKPEKSKSYELGTKWELLDGQLLLSGALFKTDKDNARVTDINDAGESVLKNIGQTTAKGIELGASGQINERWGISAGYVYQDVKLVDGGMTVPRGGTAADAYPNPATGKQVVGIPRNSLSLWSTYAINDQLTLGGGATYTDQRMVSYGYTAASGATPATRTYYALPDTWRVDLMASYKVTEDTLVQLNINNIFDENLYNGYYAAGFVNVEPGRNFVVTLKHRF